MSPELLKAIEALSKNDKKSLSQKALKTVEEVGELAKAILPFEGAPGSLHRLISREKVLEEVADTLLCALSMAFDLGADAAELESLLWEKSAKWAGLQAREGAIDPQRLPFEIHITVAHARLDEFKAACESLGVKPLLLDLQKTDGQSVMVEAMTSQKLMGSNKRALEETRRVSAGLKAAGFEVLREKIETAPWHPAAPSNQSGVSKMPPGGYFEAHLGVALQSPRGPERDAELTRLEKVAKASSAKKSANLFKDNEALAVVMLTLRRYEGSRETFAVELERLQSELAAGGFELEKTIVEFSIYDSKTAHDAAWLSA